MPKPPLKPSKQSSLARLREQPTTLRLVSTGVRFASNWAVELLFFLDCSKSLTYEGSFQFGCHLRRQLTRFCNRSCLCAQVDMNMKPFSINSQKAHKFSLSSPKMYFFFIIIFYALTFLH